MSFSKCIQSTCSKARKMIGLLYRLVVPIWCIVTAASGYGKATSWVCQLSMESFNMQGHKRDWGCGEVLLEDGHQKMRRWVPIIVEYAQYCFTGVTGVSATLSSFTGVSIVEYAWYSFSWVKETVFQLVHTVQDCTQFVLFPTKHCQRSYYCHCTNRQYLLHQQFACATSFYNSFVPHSVNV